MCEDICVYIFGYGSLIWRPGFPYLRKFDGYIKGWKRGFWQGSTDHRGTPEYPGRVVTLVKDPNSVTWGTVFCIPDEEAAAILRNLDYREKNGYIREEIDVFISGRDTPVITKSILYVASEGNTSFLGESPLDEIAEQVSLPHALHYFNIYKSVGPSGPNVDYLLNLAESMRKMNASDLHIAELENKVLNLVQSSPLSHHTHPSLVPFAKKFETSSNITITSAIFSSSPPVISSSPISSSLCASIASRTKITTITTNNCEYSTDQSVPIITVDRVCTEQNNMQKKYFLSPTAAVKGSIHIDSGAMMAVSQRGRSLLAAGIVDVTGQFDPNELVSIYDSVARGITSYGSDEIMKVKGLHSTKISLVLGFSRGDTVVHAHNMILV